MDQYLIDPILLIYIKYIVFSFILFSACLPIAEDKPSMRIIVSSENASEWQDKYQDPIETLSQYYDITIDSINQPLNLSATDSTYVYAINSDFINTSDPNLIQKHYTDWPSLLRSLDKSSEYNHLLFIEWTDDIKANQLYEVIPRFDREALYDMAQDVFWKFADAQNLIANEKNGNISASLIKNTLSLFNSPNSQIEIQITSNPQILSFSASEYLHRLTQLSRYTAIEIDWMKEFTVISDWYDPTLKKSDNSDTAALLLNSQSFTGYDRMAVVYSDVIDKTIELHATLVESFDLSGNRIHEWKVLLGDIKIAQSNSSIRT